MDDHQNLGGEWQEHAFGIGAVRTADPRAVILPGKPIGTYQVGWHKFATGDAGGTVFIPDLFQQT